MAQVKALKTGNWSDPTVWTGGVFPTSADDVYANAFTVTIDQSINVKSINTSAATGISAGGEFRGLNGVTITADVYGGTTRCLSTSQIAVGQSFTVVGNLYGGVSLDALYHLTAGTVNVIGNIYGGFLGSGNGASVVSVGVLNITGNVFASTTISSGYGISMTGTGIINIVGNVTGNLAYGIYLSTAGGTINITGNVYGSNSAAGGYGVYFLQQGTLTVTGSAIPGIGATASTAVYINQIGCTVRIKKACGANGLLNGVTTNWNVGVTCVKNPSDVTVEEVEYGPQGQPPTYGYVKFEPLTTNKYRVTRQNGSQITLINPFSIAGEMPALGDVRLGVPYNSGAKQGTVRIPAAENVRFGVPVDNTTGTAMLEAGQTWGRLLSEINDENSIGVRLKNAATLEEVGNIIASLIHQ